MAENGNGAAPVDSQAGAQDNGQQPVQVKMNVLGQYIRDMSFENVLAQKGAKGEMQPQVNVQVAIEPRKRGEDGQYEVVMKTKVISQNKDGDSTLFLLELEYAGIFQIEGVPENQLHPFLMIECPRMLFPFVRRIVADVTRDGGFPSVNLETIDFMQLYRQQLAQRQAQMAAQGGQQPS